MIHELIYVPIYNSLLWLVKILPGHDLGVAIILVTLAIKIILYYPSLASIRASRQLQTLQPRLKALQAQFKNDREGLAREQMKLYRESRVNPAASCLPLLVQAFVFYQLYQVFLSGLKIDDAGLLQPDQLKELVPSLQSYFSNHVINTDFLGLINLTASKNIFLAAITAAAQFWQTKMLAAPPEPSIKEARDESMAASVNKSMTYTLPLVMAIVTYSVPAGLGIYWSVSSILSILQQYIFLRTHPMKKPASTPTNNGTTP